MLNSVARGGGGGALAPPIGRWSMQNHTLLVLLRPKIEKSPPIGTQPPLKRWNFRFRPKNQSQFRWRPFFFSETTWFWAEKTLEFPSFPRNSVLISGQTVWNWFKNNENSGQGRLHFSHSFKIAPPPFPNPSYALAGAIQTLLELDVKPVL